MITEKTWRKTFADYRHNQDDSEGNHDLDSIDNGAATQEAVFGPGRKAIIQGYRCCRRVRLHVGEGQDALVACFSAGVLVEREPEVQFVRSPGIHQRGECTLRTLAR